MKDNNKLINNNWNKMAILSKIGNKTDQEEREFNLRIDIQNTFSNGNEKEAIEYLIRLNNIQKD